MPKKKKDRIIFLSNFYQIFLILNMRFATVIPSVLLVALLAISHVVVAESQVKSNVAVSLIISLISFMTLTLFIFYN